MEEGFSEELTAPFFLGDGETAPLSLFSGGAAPTVATLAAEVHRSGAGTVSLAEIRNEIRTECMNPR